MPRGRKPGTKLSESHKKSLSLAAQESYKSREVSNKLEKNRDTFVGPPKPKRLLSAEGLAKRTLANQRGAETKRLRLANQFAEKALSSGDWISAERFQTANGAYVRLTHKCGTPIEVQWQTVQKHALGDKLCKTCSPVFRGSSHLEDQLYEMCKQLSPNIIRHYRALLDGGLEVDLADIDAKIAIELDGLYWHSDARGYSSTKHLQKTTALEAQGWRLIHIFEDELTQKTEIVKSRLAAIFSASERRIWARKTRVVSLSTKEAKDFLTRTHLQGYASASVKLGLRDANGALVACATFGKPRFNKSFDWELIRFSTELNTSVVGGASKLISAFKDTNFGDLISYADRRWSDGGVYRALKFDELPSTPPGYFYFKGDLRLNRMSFQKSKLRHFSSFDESKTEAQIMFEDGWNRIWDCGNRVFVLYDRRDARA